MLNISPSAGNVIGRLYQDGIFLQLNATLIFTNFNISCVLMSLHTIKSLPPNSTCFVIYFVLVLLRVVLPFIGIRYYSSVIVCLLFKISYQIPLSSFCSLLECFLVNFFFFLLQCIHLNYTCIEFFLLYVMVLQSQCYFRHLIGELLIRCWITFSNANNINMFIVGNLDSRPCYSKFLGYLTYSHSV